VPTLPAVLTGGARLFDRNATAATMTDRRSGPMAHTFEIAKDIVVDASPEQVWEAIATGRGMDSWFMGRNEVEPREGGRCAGASADTPKSPP
jgi:hypothetical protein